MEGVYWRCSGNRPAGSLEMIPEETVIPDLSFSV